MFIVGMLGFFGLTPAYIYKKAAELKSEITHFKVSNQIYNAAFRALYRLDFTGKVMIDNKEYKVEIRSAYTYDDYIKDLGVVEWIFVVNGSSAEMYEAIYSSIQRTYHFVDKEGKFRYVYNLEIVE